MNLNFILINSDISFKRTKLPLGYLGKSEVNIERTYFEDVVDCSVISIKEKCTLLRVQSCFLRKCINVNGKIIEFENQNENSHFLFSHCSSDKCQFYSYGITSVLKSSSVSKNEISLCSFSNFDESHQALISLQDGEKLITDANLTNLIISADLVFMKENLESKISYSHFSSNDIKSHGLVSVESCPISIYSCNFNDLDNIKYALNLWIGNCMLISLSNFIGVVKSSTFVSHDINGHIFLLGCYIEGENPATNQVFVNDPKSSNVAFLPHSFAPIYLFHCSNKQKPKRRLLGMSFLFLLINIK